MRNKIHRFVQFLKKHIKTLYYYVPPCPLCKSPVTGHFIRLQRDTVSEWQITESLKHGELVQPVHEVGRNNCYCLKCGCQWPGDVETKWLSLLEIDEEKEKRVTRLLLNRRVEAERERVKNDHRAFKSMRRFIGKL